MSAIKLSTVVLSWNTEDLLRRCLAAVERAVAACGPESHELVVVDNASSDDSAAMVAREFPRARLIVNASNLGYAEGNNVGLRAARGTYAFLLNSDTEAKPDALAKLVAWLDAHPDCGAVGAQLLNLDGTLQRACMRFPTLLTAIAFDTWFGRVPLKREVARYFYRDFDHASSRAVDQPPGAALMLRRSMLERIGLLDPDLFLFFNDVELCRRIVRAGWGIHFLADAEIFHHGGASTRKYGAFALEWHKNRARYYRREHGVAGAALAKAMTAWRALEEWWRTARRMTDPKERAAATSAITAVVREVMADDGSPDPRARSDRSGRDRA